MSLYCNFIFSSMRKLSIIIFFLIFLPITCVAQEGDTTNIKGIELTNEQQVEILERQLATTETFLDEILNTVYWSLGILVTLAVLLVGFGWFSNFKVYERDKKALKSELLGLIEQNFKEIQTEIEKKSAGLSNEISNKIKEFRSEIQEHAEQALEGEIETLNKKISRLKSSIGYLKDRNTELKLDIEKADRRYWELKGVKANELSSYRRTLDLAVEVNNEREISSSLKGIRELLNEGLTFYHTFEPDVLDTLDNLPSKYSEEVTTIKSLIRKSKES